MVGRRGHRGRWRLWQELIARQRASGVSVRAFCRRERLAEPSFYAWRKRLAARRVSTRRGARATKAFAAVRVVEDPSQDRAIARLPENAALSAGIIAPSVNWVEIELADGVRVRVPPGVDRKTLIDVLVALREGAATWQHGVATWQHDAGGGEESPAC